MKKLMLIVIAVASALLLTVPAFAFPPCGGYGRGNGYYCDDMVWELNLTDAQRTKIEALQTAHQKEVRPIRDKMVDKSVELRRMWLQTDPDQNKIFALQKEVSALRDQLQEKSVAHRLAIRKVLTPEQQEQLTDLGWGAGPGFGPRGGMRGRGGWGGCCGYGPGMGY